jgi:hypothetical protein
MGFIGALEGVPVARGREQAGFANGQLNVPGGLGRVRRRRTNLALYSIDAKTASRCQQYCRRLIGIIIGNPVLYL